MVFFPSLYWFCGLGLFFVRIVLRLREVWFSLDRKAWFSAVKKSFSRIKLGEGCVLRKKLAQGSVRSRKPRIMPLQTTHRTSVYPRATSTCIEKLKQNRNNSRYQVNCVVDYHCTPDIVRFVIEMPDEYSENKSERNT